MLSDDMKGQMLELSRQQSSPQLVPLVDLLAQNRRPPGSESAKPEKTVVTDASRQDIASDKAVVTEARSAGVVAAGSTPPPPIVVAPPVVRELVWGRWASTAPAGDTLSRTFEEATQNGRLGTVGNGAYGLYRPAADANALLRTSEASANFRLSGGSAQYFVPYRAPEAVSVNGGSLNVDFSRATFATQLNVSNPTIGANALQADGIIRPNGVMLGQSGNAYIAGALSLDGKEAGYFFEKALPAGNLSGITLWGR